MTPACHHYTAFLHSTAQTGSVAVQLAALLPRALVHHKIGQKMKTAAEEDDPFYAWIEENGSEERAQEIGKMLTLVDELAAKETHEGVEQMQTAYTTAARLEWMFFDDAYREFLPPMPINDRLLSDIKQWPS